MNLLKKLSQKLYEMITFKLVLSASAIFIVFVIMVLPRVTAYSEETTGISSPDLSLIYSSDDIYEMAEAYGVEGRSNYVRMSFTFDLIWPLVYLFLLITVFTKVLSYYKSENHVRLLNLVPLSGVIFDYMENIGASTIMLRYPDKTPFIDSVTPAITFLKWIAVSSSLLLIIVFLVHSIYLRIYNRIKV